MKSNAARFEQTPQVEWDKCLCPQMPTRCFQDVEVHVLSVAEEKYNHGESCAVQQTNVTETEVKNNGDLPKYTQLISRKNGSKI